MAAETEAEERVLPFGVEVHRALDVDHHWHPLTVEQDMVRPELAVDKGVLGARSRRGGERPQPAGEPRPGSGYLRHPAGRAGELAQRPVEQVNLGNAHPGRRERTPARLEQADAGGVPEDAGVIAVRLGRPVVLGRAPHVKDHREPAAAGQPVDTLLTAARQPGHLGHPPPAETGGAQDARRVPANRLQIFRAHQGVSVPAQSKITA